MANIPQGKAQCYVRLKHSTLEMLRALAVAGGYPTMNTLAAELLEECARFLADGKRSEAPAILGRLKALGVSGAEGQPAGRRAAGGVPAPFTPYQLAAIKDLIQREVELSASAANQGAVKGK